MTYTPWQNRNNPKTAAERGIAREVIRCLVDAGYTVSVFDGEDYPVRKSTSKRAIFDALAQTDNDKLVARDKDGKKVGWVWLVYGNEPCELIADYTLNLEEVIQPAIDKAEATADRF
jgi:hypothetical protein